MTHHWHAKGGNFVRPCVMSGVTFLHWLSMMTIVYTVRLVHLGIVMCVVTSHEMNYLI
jgi:hypothetical protein